MILLFHLIFAVGSMAYATYLYFFPSESKMRATYGLVAFTFATGFWLVFTTRVQMGELCVTGLVYIGYVSYALIASHKKIALGRPCN